MSSNEAVLDDVSIVIQLPRFNVYCLSKLMTRGMGGKQKCRTWVGGLTERRHYYYRQLSGPKYRQIDTVPWMDQEEKETESYV